MNDETVQHFTGIFFEIFQLKAEVSRIFETNEERKFELEMEITKVLVTR
jgi:hypothetical protein